MKIPENQKLIHNQLKRVVGFKMLLMFHLVEF